MTYQTTNDFTVTRQDGTYTGATNELVVSNGGTVTLPTPTAGEKFGIRALQNDVTVVQNGAIEGSTSDRLVSDDGVSVFVSDGSEWYLVSGDEYFEFDIPDSAIAQYDATQESSTGGITSITDQIGTFDLTGNASVISSGINGKQTFRFDGTDDGMSASSFDLNTEPFAVIAVVQQQEAVDSNNFYYDFTDGSGSTIQFALQDNNNATATLRPFRGGTSGADNQDIVDLNPHIYTLEGHNTDQITIRQDGTTINTNTLSSSDAQDLKIANVESGTYIMEMDLAEMVVLEGYDSVTGTDITDEESRLADKWGVTI